MILYHGSVVEVSKPDVSFSRRNLDFGRGFYVTPIKEQAERWARRKSLRTGESPIVSVYEYTESCLDGMLSFPSIDGDWLDFVFNSRSGSDVGEYDVISGPVADDNVFKTIDLYFQGIWDRERALKSLMYDKPSFQTCFRSQDSVDRCLSFLYSYEVSDE